MVTASDRVFDVHDSAALWLSSATVRNGDINSQGGGIRSEGTLTLTNVTLSNNNGKDGGGVSVRKDSTATFTNVTFLGNTADKGAGLHVDDNTSVTISGSTFRQNTASKEGGGAYFEKGIATISLSVFENNSAEDGGGLFVDSVTSFTTIDTTIAANTAVKEGGGLYLDKTNARISRSTVSNNGAEEGGGLFVKGGGSLLALENLTVSGNTASKQGGGIHKDGNGITTLVNVTVYSNASPVGGGIYIKKKGSLSARNSLIAASPTGADCDGALVSQGNNLDSDGSCALGQPGDLSNTDPLAGPLQLNGGPTRTHALLPFSPARDAGSNAGCPGIDQRSQTRPLDGNADGIAVCDIGAFEALPVYPDYSLRKTVATLSDPYSGGTSPKAIPGAIMRYTIRLGNAGPGAADSDSIVIDERVPAGTSLVVADFDAANAGPVAFVDGSPDSGLSYSFSGLGSTTDDIDFSNDGGTTYGYVPTPAADGSDSNVTHVRVTPTGTALFTGADPVAEFQLKVVVR